MLKEIKIADKTIGKNEPCFIIAEAGVNHNGSLELAKKLVDAAKYSGADAVKFQSFTADSLQFKTTKRPYYQNKCIKSNKKTGYYDMIKKLEMSKEDQIKIADYCKEKGILFLSTPYDNESADFLDKVVKVPAFKLASIELNNHLFIRYIAKKQKPIILSTGLSDIEDVRTVVEIARKEGFVDRLILLQCTSDYPAKPEDINLNVIKTYMKEFPEVLFGLSDHSETYAASIGAVAIGAIVLEKHFTLNKKLKGPDHSSSLNEKELNEWVKRVREIEALMGSYDKKITKSEELNKTMRKYIVMTPQKAGAVIEENMLKAIRTGNGILPIEKNLKKIIGKKLKRDIKEITPLRWSMIKNKS